jgi:hypothetical protein
MWQQNPIALHPNAHHLPHEHQCFDQLNQAGWGLASKEGKARRGAGFKAPAVARLVAQVMICSTMAAIQGVRGSAA